MQNKRRYPFSHVAYTHFPPAKLPLALVNYNNFEVKLNSRRNKTHLYYIFARVAKQLNWKLQLDIVLMNPRACPVSHPRLSTSKRRPVTCRIRNKHNAHLDRAKRAAGCSEIRPEWFLSFKWALQGENFIFWQIPPYWIFVTTSRVAPLHLSEAGFASWNCHNVASDISSLYYILCTFKTHCRIFPIVCMSVEEDERLHTVNINSWIV